MGWVGLGVIGLGRDELGYVKLPWESPKSPV